ncbi:thiamine pyrophosphate-binding protein [Cellvibrio sp. UBA7671]|uniref:thiamine pyrophosphate-binding protein n=1 Tax=Cellvibrio sp. UBA7671 TaxID=1946312 RepID=UPI002F35C3E7
MDNHGIAEAIADEGQHSIFESMARKVNKRYRVSEVLLRELKRRGIKRVFGVPGRENASILFNEVEGLEYITTRVEFTAGIMADFTGRMTRTPQVCFSTMGPGATNMTTAAASAMLNHSSLILITAQLESDDRNYNLTHQCVDQRKVMEGVTKWSYELGCPEDLPWVLEKAFNIAQTEPVGPVHISIPTDFFKKEILVNYDLNKPILPRIINEKLFHEADALDAIRQQLLDSEYPLCLIGEAAVRVGAQESIMKFCTEWNIPFVTAANAKGLANRNNPLNYGAASPYMEGILGYQALEDIYTHIDTLVCVGYQYVDDLLPKMWEYGNRKTIISINSHYIREIHKKFSPDLECVGDISEMMDELLSGKINKKNYKKMDALKDVYENIAKDRRIVNDRLTPIQVINSVNTHIGDGILCTDIGYYRHHAILFSDPQAVGRFFTDAGLSSFGTGLPYAIAAQAQEPDKQIFLICGDGGFHSGSGDLETLVRYNLPAIVIVMNNNAFKLIELYQARSNEPKDQNKQVVTLGSVDFVMLAEANGCRGIRVNNVDELDVAIRSHDRLKPLLIEVPMEYRDRDSFRESF